MKRTAPILLALLLITGTAFADTSMRFGNRLVAVGDSVATLVQVAGKADRIVQLENNRGAAAGERWEYYRPDGHAVLIIVRDGVVESIQQV